MWTRAASSAVHFDGPMKTDGDTRAYRHTPLACRWTCAPSPLQLLLEPPATFCSQISATGEGQPRGPLPGRTGGRLERGRERRGGEGRSRVWRNPPVARARPSFGGGGREAAPAGGSGCGARGRGGQGWAAAGLPGSAPRQRPAQLPRAAGSMGGSSSSLLDESKCTYIRGRARHGGGEAAGCPPRVFLRAPAGGKRVCISGCALRWESPQKSTRRGRGEEILSPRGPAGSRAGPGPEPGAVQRPAGSPRHRPGLGSRCDQRGLGTPLGWFGEGQCPMGF